jgi:hypothetical protein
MKFCEVMPLQGMSMLQLFNSIAPTTYVGKEGELALPRTSCFSLHVRYYGLHPYKATGKVKLVHFNLFFRQQVGR